MNLLRTSVCAILLNGTALSASGQTEIPSLMPSVSKTEWIPLFVVERCGGLYSAIVQRGLELGMLEMELDVFIEAHESAKNSVRSSSANLGLIFFGGIERYTDLYLNNFRETELLSNVVGNSNPWFAMDRQTCNWVFNL